MPVINPGGNISDNPTNLSINVSSSKSSSSSSSSSLSAIETISLATTLLLLLVEGGEMVSTFFSSVSSSLGVSSLPLSSEVSRSSDFVPVVSFVSSVSSSITASTTFISSSGLSSPASVSSSGLSSTTSVSSGFNFSIEISLDSDEEPLDVGAGGATASLSSPARLLSDILIPFFNNDYLFR